MLKLIGMTIGALFVVSACATQMADVRADEAVLPESPLSFLFGEWVGEAKGIDRDRKPFTLTQTERIGPMLNGEITVIEGRGYSEDGSLEFNAFAVISYDKTTESWSIRSYADGRAGTFPFELTEAGYTWSIPAGPDARMVFTAEVSNGAFHQIGKYTPNEGYAVQTFEMTLTRIGDTAWPSGGIVEHPAE